MARFKAIERSREDHQPVATSASTSTNHVIHLLGTCIMNHICCCCYHKYASHSKSGWPTPAVGSCPSLEASNWNSSGVAHGMALLLSASFCQRHDGKTSVSEWSPIYSGKRASTCGSGSRKAAPITSWSALKLRHLVVFCPCLELRAATDTWGI